MRKIIILAIASLIISYVIAGCSSSKYGCPAATSQGRVKGKFRA